MTEDDSAVTRTLLEEIRDNQQLQIQRQSEALELSNAVKRCRNEPSSCRRKAAS